MASGSRPTKIGRSLNTIDALDAPKWKAMALRTASQSARGLRGVASRAAKMALDASTARSSSRDFRRHSA